MLKTKIFITILLLLSLNTLAQDSREIKELFVGAEYQKVIQILESKINNNIQLDFDEYFYLGNAYHREMNHNNAVSAFEEAKKINPFNIRNLLMLGSTYSANGNDNSAKHIFTEVLNIDSANNTALINLGRIFLANEEYGIASNIYQNLILKDSTNSYFYSQLGISKYREGEIDKAAEYFEKSIAINNSNSKIILMLARLYYNEKKYDKTLGVLKIGFEHDSKNKKLNKMLADVFYKQNNYHEAVIKYLTAITWGDTSSNTFQKLGMAYYYLSFTKNFINTDTRELKLNEGIDALKRALIKDENDPLNFLYLGLCYKELGDDTTAINYFEETLNKIYPEYIGEVYYNLAGSYDRTGKYVESIQTYKKALTYKPDKQLLNFYLANIYDRYYKDKSVAVLYYQKFVDESIEADQNLIGYSLNRIKALSQEANFWKN